MYDKNYYQSNKELFRERNREYYIKNKEKRKADRKAYYQENKEEILEKQREWQRAHADERHEYEHSRREELTIKAKARHARIRQSVLMAYGNCCACCGEREYRFLTIDHINGGGGEHRRSLSKRGDGDVSSTGVYYWIMKNNYPPGFQILCFNCHLTKTRYGICPHQEGKLLNAIHEG